MRRQHGDLRFVLADTNVLILCEVFFFCGWKNVSVYSKIYRGHFLTQAQPKEMTSQDDIWMLIVLQVLYFHSHTSVNFRATQYSDVRASKGDQSAPEGFSPYLALNGKALT